MDSRDYLQRILDPCDFDHFSGRAADGQTLTFNLGDQLIAVDEGLSTFKEKRQCHKQLLPSSDHSDSSFISPLFFSRDHSFLSTLQGQATQAFCTAKTSLRCRRCICMWRPPVFGRDVSQLLQLSLLVDSPGLPPLVIRAFYHVENLPEVKIQSLREDAAVPLLVIVEQGPGSQRRRGYSRGVCWTRVW